MAAGSLQPLGQFQAGEQPLPSLLVPKHAYLLIGECSELRLKL